LLAIWTEVVRLDRRTSAVPYSLVSTFAAITMPVSPEAVSAELPRFHPYLARQSEAGALQAALAYLGVQAPHTGLPYTEAMLFGLGGGVGFSYFVFEYKSARVKTLTLGTRITTLEESSRPQFLQTICERIGVPTRVLQSANPAAANRGVRQALAEGTPPIVWIDLSGPPYHFAPTAEYAAGVVYAWKDDRILLAGRSRRPLPFRRKSFEAARSSIGVPKSRAVTVAPPDHAPNLAAAVLSAVRETRDQMARGIDVGSFRGNFGLAALEKWAGLLTDDRDRKGWPQFFPPGRDLLAALLSVFVQIELRGRGGGAFRGLYADFLVEAAEVGRRRRLAEAVEPFRLSARAWHNLARAALPNSVPALRRLRELTAAREAALARQGADGLEVAKALAEEARRLRRAADDQFPMPASDALDLLSDLRRRVLQIHALEAAALQALRAALR
jgi:hypothetical protein